jgi:hypothetical protein
MESVCLGRSCTSAAATRMARVSCFRFWEKNPIGPFYLYAILGPKLASQGLYL